MTAKQRFIFICDNCEKEKRVASSDWTHAQDKIKDENWSMNMAHDNHYCSNCKEDDNQ